MMNTLGSQDVTGVLRSIGGINRKNTRHSNRSDGSRHKDDHIHESSNSTSSSDHDGEVGLKSPQRRVRFASGEDECIGRQVDSSFSQDNDDAMEDVLNFDLASVFEGARAAGDESNDDDDGIYLQDNVGDVAQEMDSVHVGYEGNDTTGQGLFEVFIDPITGKPQSIAQHFHYQNRGRELQWMCLYEWVACISVVRPNESQELEENVGYYNQIFIDAMPTITALDKIAIERAQAVLNRCLEKKAEFDRIRPVNREDSANNDDASSSNVPHDRHKGRFTNRAYPFDVASAFFGIYIQVVRSHIAIPIIYGLIPKLPVKLLSESTLVARTNCAKFMLSLFSPWRRDKPIPENGWSWNAYLIYLQQLSNKDAEWSSRNKLFIMNNIFYGMRVSAQKKRVFGKYRRSAVIPWNMMDAYVKTDKRERDLFADELKTQGREDLIAEMPTVESLQLAGKMGHNVNENRHDFSDSDDDNDASEAFESNLLQVMEELMRNNLLCTDDIENANAGLSVAQIYANQSSLLLQNVMQHQPRVKAARERLDLHGNTQGVQSSRSYVFRHESFVRTTHEDGRTVSGEDLFNSVAEEVSKYRRATVELIDVAELLLEDNVRTNMLREEFEGDNLGLLQTLNRYCTNNVTHNNARQTDVEQLIPRLMEVGDESPFGAMGPPGNSKVLNNDQTSVFEIYYKNVRANLHHFLYRTQRALPIHLIVQGGPGAGKTTLSQEILLRIKAYISRLRRNLRLRLDLSLRIANGSLEGVPQLLQNELAQFNKLYSCCVVMSATSGVAATIAQNESVTVHSQYKIVSHNSKTDTKAKNIADRISDTYRKPLSENIKLAKTLEFSGGGAYLHNIDEVRYYVTVNRYFIVLSLIFIIFWLL